MTAAYSAFPSPTIFKIPALKTLLVLIVVLAGSHAGHLSARESGAVAGPSPMELLDAERKVRKGDRLLLTVIESREDPQMVVVDAEGFVDIPLIRKVSAEGLTAKGLAYKIKETLEIDFYHQATVMLEFKQGASLGDRVTVLGAVARQGPLPIPFDEPLTVSQVILRAGGFTPDARESEVKLIRKDPSDPERENEMVIDIANILESGDLSTDELVMPKDLILIPQKEELESQAYVTGAVGKPGLINVPDDGSLTVSKAILLAGGFTKFANRKNVKIIRADKSLPEAERNLKVDVERILERNERGFDPIIFKDDVIRVEERWLVF